MRVVYSELLKKLGVDRLLAAYETQPWLYYDETKEITCSAEVRVGPGESDVEAEVQFVYEDEAKATEAGKTNPDQLMFMRAIPAKADKNQPPQWSPKILRVKGEDYVNRIGGWEEKGCSFFKACIQAIQMGQLPDIEELIKKELPDDDSGSGKRGRIGRKSPKINPANLMGMKK